MKLFVNKDMSYLSSVDERCNQQVRKGFKSLLMIEVHNNQFIWIRIKTSVTLVILSALSTSALGSLFVLPNHGRSVRFVTGW